MIELHAWELIIKTIDDELCLSKEQHIQAPRYAWYATFS
jgi:hypothetical protein